MDNQVMESQAANPLDQLRDIHLPEAIGWWPLAPGWWLLIILVCLGLITLARLFLRRRQASAYRRQALQKLAIISANEHPQRRLRALFELLKRTANCAYPERHPGSLGTHKFIAFLRYSSNDRLFNAISAELDELLYGNLNAADSDDTSPIGASHIDSLFVDAEAWLEQHVSDNKLEYGDPC